MFPVVVWSDCVQQNILSVRVWLASEAWPASKSSLYVHCCALVALPVQDGLLIHVLPTADGWVVRVESGKRLSFPATLIARVVVRFLLCSLMIYFKVSNAFCKRVICNVPVHGYYRDQVSEYYQKSFFAYQDLSEGYFLSWYS